MEKRIQTAATLNRKVAAKTVSKDLSHRGESRPTRHSGELLRMSQFFGVSCLFKETPQGVVLRPERPDRTVCWPQSKAHGYSGAHGATW